MARDRPREQIRCRSPASKKRQDKLKMREPLRGSTKQLSNLQIGLLRLIDSINHLNRWKILNEKLKFTIRIVLIIFNIILIYQVMTNSQLAEQLLKEIIINIIK